MSECEVCGEPTDGKRKTCSDKCLQILKAENMHLSRFKKEDQEQDNEEKINHGFQIKNKP